MSWIGKKIYEYLKECEEFKQDSISAQADCAGLAYKVFDERVYQSYISKKTDKEKFFHLTPQLHKLNDNERAELDKINTSFRRLIDGESEVSQKKVGIPRTECLPPAPEQKLKPFGICTETGMLVFCNDANDYLTYKEKQPERVPFEKFKNNRKKMKKEVRHCERYILTSVKEDGKVSITIEPKKGFDVCNVSLNVVTGELPKEPVLPKELLNPNPELQTQYDTLAKLIATRDYYNAGSVFKNSDIVAVIKLRKDVDGMFPDRIGLDGMERFDYAKSKLYFKDIKTAMKFLENFRTEIESVKHLI